MFEKSYPFLDLSRNKFNEVPEDVTKLMFVEKLDFSNNVIRSIPDTINGLKSLTFLDLSRNQLSSLPRELCQLPIQVTDNTVNGV